ncbi:MAG TPA: GGDEF domain-containing protein, partial [Pseudonocardiaceae bacterium]|nr:GGDEF domain-containing protein [Pseudonocardiaceae bacterium]
MRAYVVGVDLAAVALIVLTARLVPVERGQLLLFGGLVLGAVLHYEASKRIERIREVTAEGVSYVDLQSVWGFAALLLLPPPLVAAFLAITYAHMWLRVSQRIVVHRWVFSANTVVLASGAAGLVLATLDSADYPGLPAGITGVAVVVAAAAVRWLVNYALVVGAITLSGAPLRKAAGRPADQLIEAAALGLGYLAALVLVVQPLAVLVLMVPLLVMQHSLMISQLQHAASKDRTTGLLTAMYW